MIIPDSSKELVKNRSVFDLKAASRRDSGVAPSIVTVPPSYESALSDVTELLSSGRLRSPATSEALASHRDSSVQESTVLKGALHRHHFHWHNDPQRLSVVFRVENVLFKVQPDILHTYSPLLFDFMNVLRSSPALLAQPVDGCATLSLDVLRSQDIAELLNRVYHLHRTPAEGQSELSLRAVTTLVTPILQFSLKKFPELRKKCTLFLENYIPSTSAALISRNRKGALRCQGDTAFRILNLVRTAGQEATHLLPFAFFLCARTTAADILGSSLLSWQDKALCVAGREEISRLLRFEVYREYTSSEPFSPQRCSLSPNCATSVAAARTLDQHLSRELFGFFTKVDCLCCASCAKEMQHQVKRRWLTYIWANLPMLFRLGSWESLGVPQDVGD